MAHNDDYLDGMVFDFDGGTVTIPFHDGEALHDEDGVVKTSRKRKRQSHQP